MSGRASDARIAQMLDQAYQGSPPGSHSRWLSKAAEREWNEKFDRIRQGWALYRRVHGHPSPGEVEFDRAREPLRGEGR